MLVVANISSEELTYLIRKKGKLETSRGTQKCRRKQEVIHVYRLVRPTRPPQYGFIKGLLTIGFPW